MRIYADTANLNEIADLSADPWISGFTTNPTLAANVLNAGTKDWAMRAVICALGKPISIDGPVEEVRALGAIPKVITPPARRREWNEPINHTAIFTASQLHYHYRPNDIISIFAGRILDTGVSPQLVIDAAKATGAQVLWASTREICHYQMANNAGCDIITMSPAIYAKFRQCWGMPLEEAARLTIEQFDADRLPW